MLLGRIDSQLLRAVWENGSLLLVVVIAASVAALVHLSGILLPPSIWFRATVNVVEVSGFVGATFLAAVFILRVFRLFRREWRRTFRGNR